MQNEPRKKKSEKLLKFTILHLDLYVIFFVLFLVQCLAMHRYEFRFSVTIVFFSSVQWIFFLDSFISFLLTHLTISCSFVVVQHATTLVLTTYKYLSINLSWFFYFCPTFHRPCHFVSFLLQLLCFSAL